MVCDAMDGIMVMNMNRQRATQLTLFFSSFVFFPVKQVRRRGVSEWSGVEWGCV